MKDEIKEPLNPEAPEQLGIRFKIHRLMIMIFSLLLYTMVFFHRNSPSSMTNDLLDYFKVTKSDLSLISSMFLWSSAIIQLLVAPFADIFEPYILWTFFTIILIIGTVISGFTTSFPLFVIGRFLTGIGVGPSFLAISKFTLGWYDVKYLPVLTGLTLGFGGIGTLLSSFPTVILLKALGWRWVFHVSSIFSGVLIAILFFIGRADPRKYGYPPVKGSKMSSTNKKVTFCESFKIAWRNCVSVSKLLQFWIDCILNFIISGNIMSFQSYWSGSWIMDVKGYSQTKMSNVSIAFTVGQILPPLIVPFFSSKIGHKRVVMAMLVIYLAVCIIFAAANENIPLGVLITLLFLNTATMFIMQPSMSAIIIGLVDSQATATGLGIFNLCAFVGSAVIQMISAEILKHEKTIGNNHYTWKSYNNAVWYPAIAFMVVGIIDFYFAIDPTRKKTQSKENENESENSFESNENNHYEEDSHNDNNVAEL